MPKKNAPKIAPKTQTIIVPKGTIDPADDTVIEIPAGLHAKPIVVAKRTDGRFVNRSALYAPDQTRSYVDTGTLPPPNYLSFRDRPPDISYRSQISQAPDLDQAEDVEKEVVLRELEEFQRARRRYLVDATAVASTTTAVAVADLSRSRNSSRFLERSYRWDDQGTQTIPPPIPPRPRMVRDSVTVMQEPMVRSSPSSRRARSGMMRSGEYGERKHTVEQNSCSTNCTNIADSKVSLNDLDELEEETEDYDDDDLGGFSPRLNSTFTMRKRKSESGCDMCCSKTSMDKLPRGHRGDKPSKPKARKKTMEKSPSRASERSVNISITESCLSTDCPHGSIKKDVSCAPCCTTKFSGKLDNKRSRSLVPEEDFEKIKEQLREARKKLDEAVAMVSRTVASSSSSYAASKMTPETDMTPRSSKIMDIISKTSSTSIRPSYEKLYVRKKNLHDLQKCPLVNIPDLSSELTRPRTSKSKSTTDRPLCLEMCSNLDVPPCVSKETLKLKSTERRKSSASVTPCTITFPCDIPSATSSMGPSSISTKSLPTSSSKIQDSRPMSPRKPRYIDEEEYVKLRDEGQKRRSIKLNTISGNGTPPKEDDSTYRPSSKHKLKDNDKFPRVNEDSSRYSRHKLSISEDESRRRSSSRSKSSNDDEYPRMRDDESRSRSKSLNEDDYPRISEDESKAKTSRLKSPTRSKTTEESEPPRVKEISRKRSTTTSRSAMGSSKSRESNALCSNMCSNMDSPPCTSEDLIRKRNEELARTLRKLSDTLNSSMAFPCAPTLPCELPPAESRQEVTRPRSPLILSHSALTSSTKLDEGQRRKRESSPKMKEDSSYQRFSDNMNKKPTSSVCKASQTSDADPLCSTVCLNMDPPPCQSEKGPSAETVTPRTASDPPPATPSGVVCAAMYPCERRPTSATSQERSGGSVRSTRSLPASYTNIPETEKAVIQPTTSLTTKEEVPEPPKPEPNEKPSKKGKKEPKEKPPKKGKNKKAEEPPKVPQEKNEVEKKPSTKEENKEQGGKLLINTTTQTHTEKSVTLFKSNVENEEVLEDEQVNNALMNSLDIDEQVTKNTTVKFKKNKK